MPESIAATGSAAPKISLSLGTKPKQTPALAKRKRPHTALDDDNAERDQDVEHQEILTFERDAKAPVKIDRVIRGVEDSNWKHANQRKRQKSSIPGNTNQEAHAEVVEENLPQYGLTVVDRSNSTQESEEVSAHSADRSSLLREQPKTVDEEALEALTTNRRTTVKVINPTTEDAAFRESYVDAPSAPTVADFAATPVDGFGAALLRGYLKNGRTLEDHGYSEDDKDSGPKRRPGLLGLGAKESGLGVELGAWGKGAKGQPGEGYIPLARKSNKTGEILTEQELKDKLEQQKVDERNGAFVNGDNERRDRKKDRDGESGRRALEYRDSDSRRDRSDRDDDHRRDRRSDRDDDDRRRRDKYEDDDRRRRSRDRRYDRDSDRKHRHRRGDDEDRGSGKRRRSRSRSADGHRGHRSHHSSKRY